MEQAKELVATIKDATEELISYFDETIQVAGTLELEELGEWKVLFKEIRDHFKEHKSKFGGFMKRLDFVLVDKMVAAGVEKMDIGKVRLYANMNSYPDVPKDQLAEVPKDLLKREVDRDQLKALCEKLLEDGQPLPPWVKVHLEPTVSTRKMK